MNEIKKDEQINYKKLEIYSAQKQTVVSPDNNNHNTKDYGQINETSIKSAITSTNSASSSSNKNCIPFKQTARKRTMAPIF